MVSLCVNFRKPPPPPAVADMVDGQIPRSNESPNWSRDGVGDGLLLRDDGSGSIAALRQEPQIFFSKLKQVNWIKLAPKGKDGIRTAVELQRYHNRLMRQVLNQSN